MIRLPIALVLWPLCSLALDPSLALSQYVHDSWDEVAGLPVPAVRVVSQSPGGYIYLGTQDGLFRFNGATFVQIPLGSPGEPGSHSVSSLAWAGETLWVGTRGGLFRLAGDAVARFEEQTRLPSLSVLSLAVDAKGTLWVGTTAGLASYSKGALQVWKRSDGLPGEQIRRIAADSTGLWLGTLDGGLARWEAGTFRAFTTADGLPSQQVSDVLRDGEGRLWVATAQGLAVLDGSRFRREGRVPSLRVFNLLTDRDNNLWVAHQQGLTRLSFRPDRAEALPWEQNTLSSAVWGLLEDRDGHLWFGSMSRGLHRLRVGGVTSFGAPEGLTDRMGLVVRPSPRGGVWLGTESGLFYRNGSTLQSFTRANGLPDDEITAIAERSDGSVWVGTAHGLALLRNGTVQAHFGHALDTGVIHDLALDGDSGVWVGTDSGLWRWDGNRASRYALGAGVDGVSVDTLLRSRDGTLWVAAQNRGLLAYRDGKWLRYGKAEGLVSDSVFGLSEDDRGVLWCGGYGLARFDGTRFFRFDERHGVPSGFVYQVLDDGKGYVWLAGRGLWRLPRQELDEIASGRRTRVSTVAFNRADGMRATDCVGGEGSPAGRDSGGRLWFATAKGFASVDPIRLERPRRPTIPEVRAVVADGVRLNGGPIQLPPGTRSVELELDAPSLVAGAHTRFRYRLEGWDQDWVDIGTRRVAVLGNLTPGTYRLQLEAAAEPGSWQRAPSTLVLTQLPHVWQTGWFRLGGVAAAVGLLVLAYRIRVSGIRRHFRAALQERVDERTRIARELHDTILPELVSASMQLELARKASPGAGQSHLLSAAETIERAQRDTRSTVWDLRTGELAGADLPEAIQAYGERHAFARGIRVSVTAAGDLQQLSPEVATALYRVAQEAIGNAVRHASPQGIRVELAAEGSSVRLSVADDGKGFDPAAGSAGGHWGIQGMHERLKQLRGVLRVDSNPGKGTTVTAIVPCRNR